MNSKQKTRLPSTKLLSLAATLGLFNSLAANAATYPSTILGDNPVAYYRLEELPGSTTAFDATANHFDALYTYNVASNSPNLGLPGITTNSIAVNGGPDLGYVSIPFHPELSPTTNGTNGAPFSAECWVQANSNPSDFAVPLAMFGSYADPFPFNNASGWNFYQTGPPDGGGKSYWVWNLKNGAFITAGTVPITLVQWYHLAATFDGSNAVFYVNGIARGSASGITGYFADYNRDGQAGAGQNTGFLPFNGGIDEIAFYTNVLTAGQILTHYQVGTNSFRAVPTPPGFLTQPASITNFAGTIATFSAVANGTSPLSYQWKRGGVAISGATTTSYSLTASYPADDGSTFSVTVTNSVGSTNSVVATLTVVTNLNIQHDPFGPITRNVGSKAAFRVVANGAVPISYQWYKVAGGTTNAIAGATADTLWLSKLQLADSGSAYYAKVTNPFTSSNSAPANLTVQARAVNVPVTGYARVVVADDPVAYWRLDEPNGSTIATDAVGSFDGAYTGGGIFTFGVPTGVPHETNDPALNITAGAVVSVPYALELNPVTGPWTYEAWIRPGSQNPVQFRTVFSSMWNSDGGNHLFGWNIYQHVASYWTLNMFNGGGSGSFTSEFNDHPLDTNVWYHMVIADDLTNIRFYVNGVVGVTLSRSGFGFIPNGINGDVTVAGAPTVLGQRSDFAFDPFDGDVDDVAVYNYALNASQIQLHYRGTTSLTITKSGANVVLTWPFGTLQSATSVAGPYTDVLGATSPRTNAPTGTQTYYRVKTQ